LTNELSESSEFESFERTIKYFLRKWNIVGASVAIARNGKLIYARGFGYADSTTCEPVQPFSRFRIASISKLITAVAIMKLQEEGKLSIHDRVFGPDGILNDPFYSIPRDKRVYSITVAHLLAHEGGWTTRFGDQMFMPFVVAKEMGIPVPVDTKTIVRFALNKKLHYTPGTGRSYSNLGYAVLGLVIEKITGMPYSDYCRKNILEPCGIYDMYMARNLKSEKIPYEVTYYEPPDAINKPSVYGTDEMVPASYGGNDIEALGAAGAWVSTAPDLLKFVLHVDGIEGRRDILSNESVEFMTDTRNNYAPLGWKATVYNGTWWRTGSFPGSFGMIKRQPDGVVWVLLMNTSTWNGPEISTETNYYMTRALAHVRKWPERDLFNYYIQAKLPDDLNRN
ncbi:MAG: serine hydrolase domain-containing protein, partial [Bacteroidales bacterium]